MSSTYSTDLRIQLMGTGDQAGTWGATTNNNFQYIFEQAIAGLQTVSVTATPQALTYLNGATSTLANNQAICAALILTNGGVNANFTITTPSGSQKTYIIFNNTTYTATIQVTGSSGSTVAIPAGTTTTVFTDGTNFYSANTGVAGSYTIGSNLTVNGAITATGNITGFYSSDAKFKENIQPIENALDTVRSIGGDTFDWTDEWLEEQGGEDGYFYQKSDFGVVAQKVQKVFPRAVRTRPDGSLAVDYEKLSALAFAAIDDLAKQVEELKLLIKE